MYQTVSHC